MSLHFPSLGTQSRLGEVSRKALMYHAITLIIDADKYILHQILILMNFLAFLFYNPKEVFYMASRYLPRR